MQGKRLIILTTVLFAIFSVVNVSAFGEISGLEINGIDVLNGNNQPFNVSAGETLSLKVLFHALNTVEDARINIFIPGELSIFTREFDFLSGNTYSNVLSFIVPNSLSEELELNVVVENRDVVADGEKIILKLLMEDTDQCKVRFKEKKIECKEQKKDLLQECNNLHGLDKMKCKIIAKDHYKECKASLREEKKSCKENFNK